MFWSGSVVCSMSLSSETGFEEVREAPPRDFDVAPICFAAALFERVEDVDRFGEFRDVENAVFRLGVNPDLIYTTSSAAHRLEIYLFI
jgi:hypothetical protein